MAIDHTMDGQRTGREDDAQMSGTAIIAMNGNIAMDALVCHCNALYASPDAQERHSAGRALADALPVVFHHATAMHDNHMALGFQRPRSALEAVHLCQQILDKAVDAAAVLATPYVHIYLGDYLKTLLSAHVVLFEVDVKRRLRDALLQLLAKMNGVTALTGSPGSQQQQHHGFVQGSNVGHPAAVTALLRVLALLVKLCWFELEHERTDDGLLARLAPHMVGRVSRRVYLYLVVMLFISIS